MRHRTQASIAFSADRQHWLVVGASPDLRQQIIDNPLLHPQGGLRHSPISGIVLVSADVDGIAGLIAVRERQPFRLFAPREILDVLRANSVFDVLDPAMVTRIELVPGEPVDAGHGMTLTLLTMPGKVPLYLEDRASAQAEAADTYAARIEANGRTIVMAPGCAQIRDDVRATLGAADAVFFDGTFYTDDEMPRAGTGPKTARRMGHVPISGADGTLARLGDLSNRRILIHINNTNPVLLDGSPEQDAVLRAGFEIAHDGMELTL